MEKHSSGDSKRHLTNRLSGRLGVLSVEAPPAADYRKGEAVPGSEVTETQLQAEFAPSEQHGPTYAHALEGGVICNVGQELGPVAVGVILSAYLNSSAESRNR